MKVTTVWVIMLGDMPVGVVNTQERAIELVKAFEEDEAYQTIVSTNKQLGLEGENYMHRIVEVPHIGLATVVDKWWEGNE